MTRHTITRTLLATTLLAVPALASAARRHLALRQAEPAIDGTVATRPPVLRLWFTQRPELPVTKVTLVAPTGAAVPTGALARADSAGAPIVVPIKATNLAPGAYRVEWRTMARDGHVQKGSYGFTLAPKP